MLGTYQFLLVTRYNALFIKTGFHLKQSYLLIENMNFINIPVNLNIF